jgi:hypothetical protein
MVAVHNLKENTNEHVADFSHAFSLRGEMQPIEDSGITFVELL